LDYFSFTISSDFIECQDLSPTILKEREEVLLEKLQLNQDMDSLKFGERLMQEVIFARKIHHNIDLISYTDAFYSGPAPTPRSGAASCIVGSKMYIFGGYGGAFIIFQIVTIDHMQDKYQLFNSSYTFETGTGRLDDFYEYDIESNLWTSVEYSGASPGARENNGVVVYNGSLYLFGGMISSTVRPL
jgi:hypothetical protein